MGIYPRNPSHLHPRRAAAEASFRHPRLKSRWQPSSPMSTSISSPADKTKTRSASSTRTTRPPRSLSSRRVRTTGVTSREPPCPPGKVLCTAAPLRTFSPCNSRPGAQRDKPANSEEKDREKKGDMDVQAEHCAAD